MQDVQDDDDEEEEEEEEEPGDSIMKGRTALHAAADLLVGSSAPTHPPSSPTSTGPPPTPRDDFVGRDKVDVVSPPSSGKLRTVRQWVPRGSGSRAQVC